MISARQIAPLTMLATMSLGLVAPSIAHAATLVATTYSAGNRNGSHLDPPNYAVDVAKTLTCPSNNRYCRIEADIHVQLARETAFTTYFMLCPQVDGRDMDSPTCSRVGSIIISTEPNTYQTYNFSQNAIYITAGPHTLQTVLKDPGMVLIYNYEITYKLYSN